MFDEPQRLELSLDGVPLHVSSLLPPVRTEGRGYSGANRRGLDSDWHVRFPVKAGPRNLALTFLNRTPALLENLLEPFERPAPGGPNGYYTTQKGAYSQRRDQRPARSDRSRHDADPRADLVCRPSRRPNRCRRSLCGREIVSTLTRRAFRRSVDEGDLGLADRLVQRRARRRGFRARHRACRRGAARVLLNFCIRIEREPRPSPRLEKRGEAPLYRISDQELASRLSFFLWSSIPDDTLLDLAVAGKLKDPSVLEQQVRRMLADPRADALSTNFVGQWLFLRNLTDRASDPSARATSTKISARDSAARQSCSPPVSCAKIAACSTC